MVTYLFGYGADVVESLAEYDENFTSPAAKGRSGAVEGGVPGPKYHYGAVE